MPVSDFVTPELAAKLANVTPDEYSNLVKLTSLGMTPSQVIEAVQALNAGNDPELPTTGGRPKVLTIQAWSWLNDPAQYRDTWGCTTAEAAALKDKFETDADAAVKELTDLLNTKNRSRGSTRPIAVTTANSPGGGSPGQPGNPGAGKAMRAALKDHIRTNPVLFGSYNFTAEDTGFPGNMRFRVRLGGGLYAVAPSKTAAVDVARIARVEGRRHPLVTDHVVFWLEGKPPLVGSHIPEKVTFDGKLRPNDAAPADPTPKDKTVQG